MSDKESALTIVNLEASTSFVFRFFPVSIDVSRRANWEPQDVTIGTKPLLYSNLEGKRLVFPELWLDESVSAESLTPQLQELFALQEETAKGRPTSVLVLWGDREELVVLEEIAVTENLFYDDGTPLRARLSLTFIEVQEEVD